MYSVIWAYPWDFLDEGPGEALGRIADAGLTGVSVAAAYHSIRALCPHNPNRAVNHGEGGVVYFKPEKRFFADSRIKPLVSALAADVDPLREICREAERYKLKVHAWTVLHHNTRLGTAFPDCTIENAFGGRLLTQAFHKEKNRIRELVSDIRIHRGSRALFAGLQAVEPFVRSGEDLAERASAVIEAGAERAQFYHYGLMPLQNLGWVSQAIENA